MPSGNLRTLKGSSFDTPRANRREFLHGAALAGIGFAGAFSAPSSRFRQPWANGSQITVSLQDEVPLVRIRADDSGEEMSPSEILSAVDRFRNTGVRIEISGHLRLADNMLFEGFRNLQIVGIGQAIIEQQHAFNDASPLELRNCQSAVVSDLALLGTGMQSDNGSPPEHNGLRIGRSRYVWIERCRFGPVNDNGTVKHGIAIIDNSHWIWIRANYFRRTTAAALIVGSGIWPHPKCSGETGDEFHCPVPCPGFDDFEGHKCKNIHVSDNDFEEIAAGVVIDDATSLSWVTRNRVRLHYGDAIAVEDGSTWFSITDNICGPGRGAAVVIGCGQTGVWASRGMVANNMAAGCNDRAVQAPPGFLARNPRPSAFYGAQGRHVLMPGNLNLDVPGG